MDSSRRTRQATPSQATEFPSEVGTNAYGKCLRASRDLEVGVEVGIFVGDLYSTYDQVPDPVRPYVLVTQGRIIDARTPVRWTNHACEPNCVFFDSTRIVVARPVKAGEELTIAYQLELRESYPNGAEGYFWDDEWWNFDCWCGSPICMGRIDRFRFIDDRRPITAPECSAHWRAKTRSEAVAGRDSRLLASTAIARGELIESAKLAAAPGRDPRSLLECTSHVRRSTTPSVLVHTTTDLDVPFPTAGSRIVGVFALRDIEAGEELTLAPD